MRKKNSNIVEKNLENIVVKGKWLVESHTIISSGKDEKN